MGVWTSLAPLLVAFHLAAPADSVVVDFTMAERGIEWLQQVEAGADIDALRASFRERVAPTAGTEAIVAHWARFREWDAEIFMEWVLEALGKVESHRPLVDEDGEETLFGYASRQWRSALERLPELERDLAALKAANPKVAAVAAARESLPADAEISARFYVVLFGASNAFAVEGVNGYDLLQLPHTEAGDPRVAGVIDVWAHELHHAGFQAFIRKHMGEVADDPNLQLLGAATAEGLATCLVNEPQVGASDSWARALASADSLMAAFQDALRESLDGELTRREFIDDWLRGNPGAVYVVGVQMCEAVKEAGGRAAVLAVPEDFRTFPAVYNQAVADDPDAFRFDEALVARILEYGS